VLRDVLRRQVAEGHTVFFSSHSLPEVEELCSRIAIVRDGRLVAAESLEELRARAGHEVTIRWGRGDSVPRPEAPAFLTLSHRDETVWRGTVAGPVHRLIDFLAGKPVAELCIGRPDLETLFHRYYDANGGDQV